MNQYKRELLDLKTALELLANEIDVDGIEKYAIAERLRFMALKMKKISYGFYLKIDTVKWIDEVWKEGQKLDKKFNRNRIVELALEIIKAKIESEGIKKTFDI